MSTLFRNFGFAELTFRSEMQKKTRFLLHFSHLFRNFAHVMAKDKVMYVCENCGQESAKWIGKCPSCGQWNTFKEIKVSDNRKTVAATSAAASAGHTNGSSR